MYRALYRKWRPLTFQDVVGQTAIVTALRNQIATGHVGHAYLFTGVRGTGKTSCAKIFAKAINCMHPSNGDPCGVCEACRGIENGSILDVVEMDAASNNGVDNIRDLRDETAYTPSTCNYKVYIIDEVHMLSTAAFNALLKTLEEPPPHVAFILATTEIQKVPATILSRCQRYDFTRIQPSDLASRALYVAKEEGFQLTEGAADLIARLADGALRDTLSILDTCAGVTNEIDEEVVRRMAGVTDRSYLFEISRCITTENSVGALAELAVLRQKSVDLKRLAEELILHYRNLMLCSLPNGHSLLSGVSPEEEAQYIAACKEIPQSQCVHAIRTLGTALEKMSRGGDQRIELELAFFSLIEPAPMTKTVVSASPVAPAQAAPAPFIRAAAPVITEPAPFIKMETVPSSAPLAPISPVTAPPETIMQPSAPIATHEAPVTKVETVLDAQPIPVEDDYAPISDDDAPPVVDAIASEVPSFSSTDIASAPVVNNEKETVLSAVAARKQAPQVVKKAAVQTSDVPSNELAPFPVWPDILKILAQKDPMLYSHLKRSSAYRQGKRVLIEGNLAFRNFIRVNKGSQTLIKTLIYEATGETCSIGPYEPSLAPSTAINAEDSLRALGKKGLNISIKD